MPSTSSAATTTSAATMARSLLASSTCAGTGSTPIDAYGTRHGRTCSWSVTTVWSRLTLNRPEKKNAIDRADVARAHDDASTRSPTSRDDRVLVITGAGDAFCSGADLTRARSPATSQVPGAVARAACAASGACCAAAARAAQADDRRGQRHRRRRRVQPRARLRPDHRVRRARFSEIFARRGLSVDFGGSWLLPRLIGLHKAKELALPRRDHHGRGGRAHRHREPGRPRRRAREGGRRDRRPHRRAAADADLDHQEAAEPVVLGVDGGGARVRRRRADARVLVGATPPRRWSRSSRSASPKFTGE